MSKRRYTVGRRPGWQRDNTTPEVRIAGKWLSKIGFDIGDYIDLFIDNKQIIIRPAMDDDEIPEMVEELPGAKVPETRFPSWLKMKDLVVLNCKQITNLQIGIGSAGRR